MNKKKLIIFDFDGVLFNSLKNMETAWKEVNLKFGLKIKFQEYKKNIGLPFQVILKNLGINSKKNQIQKYYNLISTYNIDNIQPYKNTLKTINKLIDKKQNDTYLLETKADILFNHGYSLEAKKFYELALPENSNNIHIKKSDEILPWKKFNSHMAISIEYDLEY